MPGVHYYKYRSLSNLRYFLDILIYKRLYMASYSELNDPIEGAFVITGDRRKIDNLITAKRKELPCKNEM